MENNTVSYFKIGEKYAGSSGVTTYLSSKITNYTISSDQDNILVVLPFTIDGSKGMYGSGAPAIGVMLDIVDSSATMVAQCACFFLFDSFVHDRIGLYVQVHDTTGATASSYYFPVYEQWFFLALSVVKDISDIKYRAQLYETASDSVPIIEAERTRTLSSLSGYKVRQWVYTREYDSSVNYDLDLFLKFGPVTHGFLTRDEVNTRLPRVDGYLDWLSPWDVYSYTLSSTYNVVLKKTMKNMDLKFVFDVDAKEYKEIADTGTGGAATTHNSNTGTLFQSSMSSAITSLQSKFLNSASSTWRSAAINGSGTLDGGIVKSVANMINNTIVTNLQITADHIVNSIKVPIVGSWGWIMDSIHIGIKAVAETAANKNNLASWCLSNFAHYGTATPGSHSFLTTIANSSVSYYFRNLTHKFNESMASRYYDSGSGKYKFTNIALQGIIDGYTPIIDDTVDLTGLFNQLVTDLTEDLGPVGTLTTPGIGFKLSTLLPGTLIVPVAIYATYLAGVHLIIEVIEFLYFTIRVYPIPTLTAFGFGVPIPVGVFVWLVGIVMDYNGERFPFTDYLDAFLTGTRYYSNLSSGFGIRDAHHDLFLILMASKMIGWFGNKSYRGVLKLIFGWVLKRYLKTDELGAKLDNIATEIGVGADTGGALRLMDKKINFMVGYVASTMSYLLDPMHNPKPVNIDIEDLYAGNLSP